MRHVHLIIIMVVVRVLPCADGRTKMHSIHWNTTNPIFRIDNTDHIIDVNKGNNAFEYDQVNIICPVYTPGTHEEDAEKYIIYNVSKEEYETCRITNPNPRVIAVCDKPYKLMYFTITFRSFTPQPGGLEFRPGQDYYFISTSSIDDLHRRVGGRCNTHNMKVVFKVCCKNQDVVAKDSSERHRITTSTARTTSSTSTTTTTTTTTTRPTTSTTTARSLTGFKNSFEVPILSVKSTTKKSDEFNRKKHPNEVAKNEELTSPNSCERTARHQMALVMLVTLLTCFAPILLLR